MIDAFFGAILPVFSVVLIGFVAARLDVFDAAGASWINRFVFLIAVPALLFRLVATAPLASFPWNAALGYLLVELVVIALGFLVARFTFRRALTESFLIGMTAGFSNHVFVVFPISTALFGEAASRAILAIMIADNVAVFSLAILALDATRPGAQGGAFRRLMVAIRRSPPVLAMFAGLAFGSSGVPLPEGFAFFLRFLGDAAAPASLFALGVVLASRSAGSELLAPVIISGLKIVVAPLLVWWAVSPYGLGGVLNLAADDARAALLTAAGPCGAMPFVLALQFGVPPQTLARAILISTACSAFILSAIIGSG